MLQRGPSPARSTPSPEPEDDRRPPAGGKVRRGKGLPREKPQEKYGWARYINITLADVVHFHPSWFEPSVVVYYKFDIDRKKSLAKIRELISPILSRHGF